LGARALALVVVLVSGAPASLSAVSSARLNSALRLLPPCWSSGPFAGLFRSCALVELGNILASDFFCVVCGLIDRSFVRVMQWLCFRLSVPTMGTNTARVLSGAGRIPPLGARRTGTDWASRICSSSSTFLGLEAKPTLAGTFAGLDIISLVHSNLRCIPLMWCFMPWQLPQKAVYKCAAMPAFLRQATVRPKVRKVSSLLCSTASSCPLGNSTNHICFMSTSTEFWLVALFRELSEFVKKNERLLPIPGCHLPCCFN
jgi:hypothetical protein